MNKNTNRITICKECERWTLTEDFKYHVCVPIRVILPCSEEWKSELDVTFLDISENIFGEDVLTFRCPSCNEIHESKRFG